MRKVLIVEDDQDIREALTELLQDEGYGVDAATNGAEALELLNRIDRPGLILLDLVMPMMDGVEFLERVKTTAHADIPVVVLSASATVKPPPGTRALMKPVALESVLALVRERCGHPQTCPVDTARVVQCACAVTKIGAAESRATQAACILVVDDDEAIREALMDVLSDEGYAVACAENGKRALESIKKKRPSLVLLDLMMPVMSGWEVLDTLKGSSALADLPVVIVSAMTAPGARATLAKPVALEELLAVVRRLVGTPRGQA